MAESQRHRHDLEFKRRSHRQAEQRPDGRSAANVVCRFAFAGVFLGWCATQARAEDDSTSPAADARHALRYEAVCPLHISVGGRLHFELRLHNDGQRPVTVFWGDYAYENMYRFDVTHEDGTKLPIFGSHVLPDGAAGASKYFRRLAPGQTLEYDVFLSPLPAANGQRCFFRRPGRYVVRPSFHATVTRAVNRETGEPVSFEHVWTGRLDAEPIQITVDGDAAAVHKGFRISGRVSDEAGQPLPNARVIVEQRRQSHNSFDGFMYSAVDQALTGADGGFEFRNLPADCPLFRVFASHPERPTANTEVTTEASKTEYTVELKLPKGRSMKGVIVDSQGKPVSGVRVTYAWGLDGRGRSDDTDELGRFELHGLHAEGDVHFNLFKRGYEQKSVQLPAGDVKDDVHVQLFRESELGFSGRVRFVDGRPASRLNLEFKLLQDEKHVTTARCTTDVDGRFEAVLPRAGTYRAKVVAVEPGGESYDPHLTWLAELDKLGPQMNDVALVLEDRGVIETVVTPAGPLPESIRIQLQWRLIDGHERHLVAKAEIGSAGGTAAIPQLTPGKYQVEASVVDSWHWNWTQEVEVGRQPEKFTAKVEFKLPEMHFGRLRARLLQPDGKTPAPEGIVWFDSTKAGRWVKVEEGVLELNDVPAGWIILRPRIEGLSREPIRSEIRPDETTDLGRVVLKRFEDTVGWVEGRIRFDDGTPVLGAGLINEKLHLTPKGVDASGRYRTQLPIGEGTVVVDLSAAVGWPSGQRRTVETQHGLSMVQGDRLLVPVQVRPNQTVTKDIVLPKEPPEKVTVRWEGEKPAELSISVYVDTGQYRLVRHRYNRTEQAPNVIETAGLPTGKKVVTIYSSVAGIRGYREFTADEKSPTITIKPDGWGSIAVKPVDAAGRVVKGIDVGLGYSQLAEVKPVRGVDSSFHPIGGFAFSPGQGPETRRVLEDGTIVLSHLLPGRYTVRPIVEGQLFDEKAKRVAVDVRAGETVDVKLPVENDAKADGADENGTDSPSS